MKAKVGKAKVPAKAPSKPAKAVAAVQPAKHAAEKSASKSPVKPGTPTVAKVDARTSAQASRKPDAKATTKAAVKPAAKPPVKAVKPGASKALPKPAVTVKNQKPAPKVAAKKVNPVLQVPTKSAAKPVAKPVDKKEPKAKLAKPAAPSVAKGKPDAKAISKPVAKAVPSPVAMPAVSSAASAALVPAKAGRPSSRLAQLTVPSMAQSVASTAAKSSFTQSTALPLIVPPLPSATKKDPKLANNWMTKPVEQMTDAELLSMPDSEYMNDKQMAVFRLKLSILKQDILNSASDTTEHLREDTVVVPDPADRATIEEEHALELRTRDRERKLLKKIEQSINRIDAGDYGYCDETGEPIGVGRLLARPTATLSLEAQQRRELKQKMFGD